MLHAWESHLLYCLIANHLWSLSIAAPGFIDFGGYRKVGARRIPSSGGEDSGWVNRTRVLLAGLGIRDSMVANRLTLSSLRNFGFWPLGFALTIFSVHFCHALSYFIDNLEPSKIITHNTPLYTHRHHYYSRTPWTSWTPPTPSLYAIHYISLFILSFF